MEQVEYRGAWQGDPAIKAATVERMRLHRERDEFIQGEYQRLAPNAASGYKGCALGCMVPKLEDESGEAVYAAVGNLLGIPYEVGEAIDETFESCETFDAAAAFAVGVVEAIPVGADLKHVNANLLDHLYGDPDGLIAFLSALPVVGVPVAVGGDDVARETAL